MLLLDRVPVCKHGDKTKLQIDLLRALAKIEQEIGQELLYTSGYRCDVCNELAGGAKDSAHLRGLAVDISVETSLDRYSLLDVLFTSNVRRIGVYQRHIHIDVDDSLIQFVCWRK